ncbi:hypothetical protein D3C84_524570 [compost metagenome]
MLHQRLEKWRQQAIKVVARRPRHLACEKRHGIFEQVENAAQLVQFAHGIGRGVFQRDLLAQGKDRQMGRAQAGQANQLDHVLQQVGIFPSAFGGDQHARQAMVGGGNQAPFGVIDGREDTETFLFQLPGDAAHAVTGYRIGLDVAVDNQDGKLQVFIHGGSAS